VVGALCKHEKHQMDVASIYELYFRTYLINVDANSIERAYVRYPTRSTLPETNNVSEKRNAIRENYATILYKLDVFRDTRALIVYTRLFKYLVHVFGA